jgi:hypothetical protein
MGCGAGTASDTTSEAAVETTGEMEAPGGEADGEASTMEAEMKHGGAKPPDTRPHLQLRSDRGRKSTEIAATGAAVASLAGPPASDRLGP